MPRNGCWNLIKGVIARSSCREGAVVKFKVKAKPEISFSKMPSCLKIEVWIVGLYQIVQSCICNVAIETLNKHSNANRGALHSVGGTWGSWGGRRRLTAAERWEALEEKTGQTRASETQRGSKKILLWSGAVFLAGDELGALFFKFLIKSGSIFTWTCCSREPLRYQTALISLFSLTA